MNITYGNPLMMGATRLSDGYNFAIQSKEKNITLKLYQDGEREAVYGIELDDRYKTGDIFSVQISDTDLSNYSYNYSVNEKSILDPYAKTVSDCEKFGIVKPDAQYMSRVQLTQFDWKQDRNPIIPYDRCIIYKLHARGFTRSKSSGVSNKGTFAGIIEKIPYLKQLGITTIELMPAYEFEEVVRFGEDKQQEIYTIDMKKPLNYWGYVGGMHFAPKASYSANVVYADGSDASGNIDYTVEFKQLVRELHANGLEIVMEMFFNTGTTANYIYDCVRYWVMEYHIDGVHLYADQVSLNVIAADPLLSNTKIFTVYWEGNCAISDRSKDNSGFKNIANYNDGFSTAARKYLKGDEDQLSTFLKAIKSNPVQSANINYITNHNGFTLKDLVSYDRKHNKANGEDNRDGENYNNSWNCGVEGKSRKKKIVELRQRQIKNAFMLLLLGQGTPLIMSGDEFENSQEGNNNPYCIDSEISWVNWDMLTRNTDIEEYVKKLIEFRKAHTILHMPQELLASDYLACGYPDISYHGSNAWYTGLENYDRHVGVMYCSKYADESRSDELVYIAYNMHWEQHELALPNIAQDCNWRLVLNSASPEEDISVDENSVIVDNRIVKVAPRSVSVYLGTVKQVRRKKSRNELK